MSAARWGAGFASTERFVAEIRAAANDASLLKPGYILVGDEIFLYERCRRAVLQAFVPRDMRDFCLSDLDLAESDRSRADAVTHGALSGFVCPQFESALWSRCEKG